jgi:DNA invertase Pin-like site-specific DNA recombinase
MATIGIYARVSTADQDLEHQKDSLLEFAEEVGRDGDDIEVIADKSTGSNTDRSGYRDLMERVRNGEIDIVVVRSVTRIARDMRDLYSTVDELVDQNCGLYIKNDQIEIEPGDDMSRSDKILFNTFALAAELEAEMIRERTLEGLRAAEQAGKWTTRPPYGFTTDDEGYLQPDSDFRKAVRAIMAVEEEGMSDRKASRHSGVPRRTIPNILDRKDLYLSEVQPTADS